MDSITLLLLYKDRTLTVNLKQIKSGASSSAIFNSDHHHPAIIFKLKSITNVSSFKFYCQGVKSKCLSRAAFLKKTETGSQVLFSFPAQLANDFLDDYYATAAPLIIVVHNHQIAGCRVVG